MNLVHKLSAGVAGTSLALMLAVSPASAAHLNVTETVVGRNGAAGLVAAAVQANNLVTVTDSTIDIAVVELNNSLNNLRALNNVLNNNNVDINVQDVSVLSDNQIEILENANINLDDVVGVAILSGGDFIVFQ